jgi:hypothetical protein
MAPRSKRRYIQLACRSAWSTSRQAFRDEASRPSRRDALAEPRLGFDNCRRWSKAQFARALGW